MDSCGCSAHNLCSRGRERPSATRGNYGSSRRHKQHGRGVISGYSPQYTTVDGQIGFQKAHRWLLTVDVFNIANVKWNDIEYYYVSRLKNETAPQPDYVVHPGVPRTVRARFTYEF